MILKTVQLYRYNIPLTQSITIKGKEISTREGLIIEISNEHNQYGYGEIAPLENYSDESIDDCIDQVQSISSFLTSTDMPEHPERLNGSFETWLGNLNLESSVRFGVESAILNLIAQLQQKPLYQIISARNHDQVRTSGLLTGSQAEIENQANQLLEKGFQSFKLKVGGNLQEDISKTIKIAKILEGKALLHVDVNQAWTINEAITYCEEVGYGTLEYIEEPFKDIKLIPEFMMKTTIPVALDESLRTQSLEEIKHISGIDYFILKPTTLNGIERVFKIAEEASRLAIAPIISSCFETSIGLSMCAHLAGALGTRERFSGLDTVKFLKNDLITNELMLQKDKIDITSIKINRENINFNHLKPVD